MALLFMDSADHYATADLTEKWTTKQDAEIESGGRNGTNCIHLGGTSDFGNLTATVLGGIDEVIVGVAFKPHATWGGQASLITFGSVNNWECGLMVNADLTLQPFVAAAVQFLPGYNTAFGYAALIGSPSVVALQGGVWAYVEVRMKCNGSTGTCVVHVNGTEVLDLSDLDTLYSSSVLTRVALGVRGVGTYYCTGFFDDLVVLDTTGDHNNDLLGDVTVAALFPTADGNSHAWVCSTGTPDTGVDHDCVQEAAPNDDTNYVTAGSVGLKSTFAMQDAPAGADIRGVQLLVSARKVAEGPGQVMIVTRSNSTDYDSDALGLGSTSYSYVRQIMDADPATGDPWLEADWNAAEVGMKKTG